MTRVSAPRVAALAGMLAAGWATPSERLASALADTTYADELQSLAAPHLPRPGRAEVERACDVLASAYSGRRAPEILLALAEEHAALFLGPPRGLVPAYETQWVEGHDADLFVSPTAQFVARAYAEAGFDLVLREPPDSVWAELGFVSELAAHEPVALPASAKRRRAIRHEFVRDHVSAWVPRFAEAVQQATTSPFYAAMGALTNCLVTSRRLG